MEKLRKEYCEYVKRIMINGDEEPLPFDKWLQAREETQR